MAVLKITVAFQDRDCVDLASLLFSLEIMYSMFPISVYRL